MKLLFNLPNRPFRSVDKLPKHKFVPFYFHKKIYVFRCIKKCIFHASNAVGRSTLFSKLKPLRLQKRGRRRRRGKSSAESRRSFHDNGTERAGKPLHDSTAFDCVRACGWKASPSRISSFYSRLR